MSMSRKLPALPRATTKRPASVGAVPRRETIHVSGQVTKLPDLRSPSAYQVESETPPVRSPTEPWCHFQQPVTWTAERLQPLDSPQATELPAGTNPAGPQAGDVIAAIGEESEAPTYHSSVLNTPVISQSLTLVPDEDQKPPRAREPTGATKVAIDWLHQDALGAFVVEAPPGLAQLASDAATSLGIGTDRERNDARIRLAARMIVIGRIQLQSLELSLAAAVEHRDDAAVVTLNRVLEGSSRRLARWLEEHRLSCSSAMRPVSVAVNAIGDVTITGER